MKIKKLSTLILAALMLVFALTGCMGNFYPVALRVDDEEISPGTYLLYQLYAYYEAEDLAEKEDKDVRNQRIEGMNGKKWIKNRAVEMCVESVAIKRISQDAGVELSEDSLTSLAQNDYMWASLLSELYLKNGISYDTWYAGSEANFLKNDLFKSLYLNDSEKQWSREQLSAEVEKQFLPLRFMFLDLKVDGDLSENIDEFKQELDKLLEELRAGKTSIEDIIENSVEGLYKTLGKEYDPEAAPDISISHIDKDTERDNFYTDEWLEKLDKMSVGEYDIYYTENNTVLIYEKVKPFNDEDENYESTHVWLTTELRWNEYEEYIKSVTDSYSVKIPFGMQTFYRPSKIDYSF